jgi:hypothetical protein
MAIASWGVQPEDREFTEFSGGEWAGRSLPFVPAPLKTNRAG